LRFLAVLFFGLYTRLAVFLTPPFLVDFFFLVCLMGFSPLLNLLSLAFCFALRLAN